MESPTPQPPALNDAAAPQQDLFTFRQGSSPLLISIPHAGTCVPEHIKGRFSDAAQPLPDTDWCVDRLYDFAPAAGAGVIVASHSRYVIDLNRPPDDTPLYALGGTDLLPTATFAGEPVYRSGMAPDSAETKDRLVRYWQPYHDAVSRELGRISQRHGHAVLLDAHSIAAELPLLFEGVLPALNLGTNRGRSATREIESGVFDILKSSGYPAVLNERFKGGYITRQYGQPQEGLHALQLELSQRTYMAGSPAEFDSGRAARLRETLHRMVDFLVHFRPVSAAGSA